MPRQIVINSASTGKYREETINDRPHIVTSMVSIEGDTVMNSLFYPAHEVMNSYQQLNRLPAPAAHPSVGGRFVSANDPVAINAFNIGAFVLNPTVNGKQIFNDLAIDIEVAEKDDRGIEILRRIKNKEQIGVSTGLNADITNARGEHEGQTYRGILSNFQYDHVAILLDEKPAGKRTYTQNSKSKVMICNLAESHNELHDKIREAAKNKFGGDDIYVWVVDVFTEPDEAIIEVSSDKSERMIRIGYSSDLAKDIVLLDNGTDVQKVVTYKPTNENTDINNQEGDDMDKEKLVLSAIANSSNTLGAQDKDRLTAMSESEFIDAVNAAVVVEVTLENATKTIEEKGMTVNAKDFDKEGYDTFVTNKDDFDAYLATKAETRKTIIAGIIANSKSTEDDLKGFDDAALKRFADSIIPNNDFSAQDAGANHRATEIDYS